MSEDESEEDENSNDDEEDITPENCSMGGFSPGTEECEFCSWRDICEEEFLKRLKNEQR